MPGTDSCKDNKRDSFLIPRIRAGDRVAFETLFRANVQTAFRFALSLVGDPDTAEDLVQDVFGWIWMHRTDWNPQDGALVYILGAIRNRALNDVRNAKLRAEHTSSYAAGNESPAHGVSPQSPDHAAHQADLRHIIWGITAELTEQRRTVVILRWYYMLDWPEIATVMGISVNAAQVHHTRALADLRNRLPDWFREDKNTRL